MYVQTVQGLSLSYAECRALMEPTVEERLRVALSQVAWASTVTLTTSLRSQDV